MNYKLKKIDIFNILLLVFALFSYIIQFSDYKLFLWVFVSFTTLRVIILLKRKILWKTRNRLIFSGLFFVITPLFFIISIFIFLASIMIGQYGVTIINNFMDIQLKSLEEISERKITQYEENSNNAIEVFKKDIQILNKRLKDKANKKKTHLILAYFKKKEGSENYFLLGKSPETIEIEKIVNINELNGYFILNNKLYFGVISKNKEIKVLTAININQQFFTEFVSKIGDFSIKYNLPRNIPTISESVKNDVNREDPDHNYDFSLSFYSYNYIDFDRDKYKGMSSFPIKFSIPKMYDKWKKHRLFNNDNEIIIFIYVAIAFMVLLIIISFLVGFKIVRVITKSINQLTKGTHKIRNGDFSYRIKIRSNDQLQYLGESFNEMASGINRLLIEEKEKHRLEEELRIARTIQEKLLPEEKFETDQFEISAINIPAEEIAGDYFDYYYKKNDYLMLIIADVSGKGASAAFYMAELKGVNNHLRKTDISPAKLTAEFHYSLADTFDRVTFITISIAKFNIPEKKFVFSRAGHTKGLFYNKNENLIMELSPNGIAIGMPQFCEEKIKELTIEYNSGDILILFSDGLSEIMNENGEMFEIERIKSVLEANKDENADTIKDILLKESELFAQNIPNSDDLTLIVLKVK